MSEDTNQPPRRMCGTMMVNQRLMDLVSGYREARNELENFTLATALAMVVPPGCRKIPVVVHVVYRTEEENISDQQIFSQIAVLNEDFRRKNSDVSSVPPAFQSLTADAKIFFELATEDPEGNPTNGITRTETTRENFSDDDTVKSIDSGGADPWPSEKYLNIWVCNLLPYLGYAQFPAGPAETDGVVILHAAFGTTGTAKAPFNKGRTTTHEVGHWLNLRHIWGDDLGGCTGSDNVADTPDQGGPNYNKPTYPKVSCNNGPHGDMFMNYMDYVDDDTMVMFTPGQVSRMHTTLGSVRVDLGRTVPCAEVIQEEELDESQE